jgi:DNA-binding FadR family transcriptional regulator
MMPDIDKMLKGGNPEGEPAEDEQHGLDSEECAHDIIDAIHSHDAKALHSAMQDYMAISSKRKEPDIEGVPQDDGSSAAMS